MSIDKQKVAAAADKYARKGAYDKAIRELLRLVEAEPDDVRTLLKIGNLYSLVGDNANAVATFLRVADQFREGGFYQKAVAVYKQINKLAPERMDVYEALGSMYQAQGLSRDALHAFRKVLDHYKESGDDEGVLRTLGTMCQIDPDNVALRTKYADHLARHGKVTIACQQFNIAMRLLRSSERTRDYIKVAERLLYFRPDDGEVIRELVRVYLAEGNARQALAKLQGLYSANPRDIDTLELLSEAFVALGETHKATSVLKELGRIYAAEYPDQPHLSDNAWQRAAELAPDDPEILDALGVVDAEMPLLDDSEIEALDPDELDLMPVDVVPVEPLPGRPARPRTLAPEDRLDEIARLLTEFDVCLRYNLHDQAEAHLAAILALEPRNLDARHRRALLDRARGRNEAALEGFVDVATEAWNKDKDLALSLVSQIVAIDPAHDAAFHMVMSWGLDPTVYGLDLPKRPPPRADAPTLPALPYPQSTRVPPPTPPRRRPPVPTDSRTTSPRPALDLHPDDLAPLRPRVEPRAHVYQTLPPDAFELVDDLDIIDEQATLNTFEIEDLDASIDYVEDDPPEAAAHQAAAATATAAQPDNDFARLFDVDEDDLDNLFNDDFLNINHATGNPKGGFGPSAIVLAVEDEHDEPPPPPPAPRELTVQQLSALLEDVAEAEFFLSQGLLDDARDMIDDLRRRFGDDPRIMKVHASLIRHLEAG